MQSLTITRPDDWHLHLRDGAEMASALSHTTRVFARAVVMPNLGLPIIDTVRAAAYRKRIIEALPRGARFEPLMTLYLTDNTSAEEIARARRSGFVCGVKYYPAGATTNSDSGVTRIERVHGALEAMQEHDLPLLVHGEVTTPGVDVFERERVFLETVLAGVVRRFPRLRVVVEHASTRDAVEFVSAGGPRIAATITAHHLLYNRGALFAGGFRPHYYCLPVLKREEHRAALVRAATSGDPKFFLGTDSAPHARADKESGCAHAGIFSAPAALELYAEAFEAAGALDKLEGFASVYGPGFYGLPRNTGTVTLRKADWTVPGEVPFGPATVVPLRGGEVVRWRIAEG